MSTVTISRQPGSLGTEIAQGVAEEIRYEYVDKKKLPKPCLRMAYLSLMWKSLMRESPLLGVPFRCRK
jgi:hypothetical protein